MVPMYFLANDDVQIICVLTSGGQTIALMFNVSTYICKFRLIF